jgi:hypothetical protein
MYARTVTSADANRRLGYCSEIQRMEKQKAWQRVLVAHASAHARRGPRWRCAWGERVFT